MLQAYYRKLRHRLKSALFKCLSHFFTVDNGRVLCYAFDICNIIAGGGFIISNEVEATKFEKEIKREVMARRKIRERILLIISRSKLNLTLFTLFMITLALFIIAALLQHRGTFTVSTPMVDMINYGLVLSDTVGFERPRREIRADAVEDMWNITETDLPEGLDDIDGAHNGANYLAYTFYAKNSGVYAFTYDATVIINEMYLDIDEAMRIRLYVNGEPALYAKQRSDGSGQPEPGTQRFLSPTRIISVKGRELEPEQVDKYTFVLWLEGEDPECVNDILGGFIKMCMDFNVQFVKADLNLAAT